MVYMGVMLATVSDNTVKLIQPLGKLIYTNR